MSDIAPAADPVAPAAPAPEAVDPPALEVPTAEPTEPEEDVAGLEALPESWQKEVKKLRAESAKHRTAASAVKPVADVFGRFDEGSQARLLELLDLTANSPKDAASAWREIADLLDGPAEPAEPGPEADRPLTRAEYEKMRKDEADAKTAAEATAAIEKEARDLGYTPGTGEYVTLLWSARNEHGGDLTKAHEAQAAKAQKIIDDYLAAKRTAAEGTPTAGSGGGAPPANDRPPKTFAEADASVRERIKAFQK